MDNNSEEKIKKSNNQNPKPLDTHESLKTESTKENPEQKGYNEQNQSQKGGSFTPDSKSGDKE